MKTRFRFSFNDAMARWSDALGVHEVGVRYTKDALRRGHGRFFLDGDSLPEDLVASQRFRARVDEASPR